jgi:uncharacterized protein
MDQRLLDILVCPLCKGQLTHNKIAAELTCLRDKLAFPIKDGIPALVQSEARVLSDSEEGATAP